MTLREKIGQLFMPAAFINDSEEEIKSLEGLIATHHVGALCFFHSRASAATNFEGKKKVLYNEQSFERLTYLINRYQKAAKYPLLIAIDAEWGLAMRIENTPQYPYAITLGALPLSKNLLIYQVGQQIAQDCLHAGIHWNLAPVIDINSTPKNPVIGYRSFGSDKIRVTAKAKAFLDGMASCGILNSVKHFPGHGDTAVDSHIGLPIINKSLQNLQENELYPFKHIAKENLDSIMVGHLALPQLEQNPKKPATLSKTIINSLIREELQYNGVVISDALNMHSISKLFTIKGEVELQAFKAGVDILCFTENTAAGIAKIEAEASASEIDEKYQRIQRLKQKALQQKTKHNFANESSLNAAIAQYSLTNYTPNFNLSRFKKEPFQLVNLGTKTSYFTELLKQKAANLVEAINSKQVLIVVNPPSAKPLDNFGLSKEEIELFNTLVATKNALIYHFGNPYALNTLAYKKAKGIYITYQDFKPFQTYAAQHFLEELPSYGELPVNLD
ncbi:glycoside hydrolase family 3 protein [Flavobacterium sp. ASW18X]|uniref:glycoside hydrolase family 3 protein n=1 Tax=Flavobacterium sp. ASW18X TaxID=2572595 RepID=UPI0010AE6BFD|nr:glycoside hydrolase family 3 N-terminal domain-containing protein [Flavobacterium sp. ASW18X]TKD62492.1 glycoside hydrolase family 3 protein [Flavobacterium sp. ASW18X]